jgi:hypothetical protein
LAGVDPFARRGEFLDHAFDVGGQPQLEEKRKVPRLRFAHDPLVAETAIATQQGWPEVARQAIDERPQARRAVFGRMLVAGRDIDIEDQTRRSHRIGVIAMARTPRLLGIVAQDRPFLMTIERLDRRIDIEDPRLGQQRLDAKPKMTTQPSRAFGFVDRLEGAPDRILADDLLHPQKIRQHSVAAQRRNMRIAPVAGEHREHRRADNVALAGRIRAHIAQRTVGHEGVEQPGRLEEIDEERQLPQRRHRRLMVPFNPDRTEETVEIDAPRRPPLDNLRLSTRPVR